MLSLLLGLAIADQAPNTLSPAEAQQGWKLLFDGQTTKGWKSFGGAPVRKGWEIKDGVLKIADPGAAGDIVTEETFQWFELKIDVKIEKGQNSGIMYHVGDGGGATWHSGPEIQIYDHQGNNWAQRLGWLYELYKSEVDSSKPAGEWNTLEIRVAKDTCWTKVNGVTYYTYQLGSDDFKERVAKSKFKDMKDFGKLGKGRIAIQGDHGVVSFRNIKIKTL